MKCSIQYEYRTRKDGHRWRYREVKEGGEVCGGRIVVSVLSGDDYDPMEVEYRCEKCHQFLSLNLPVSRTEVETLLQEIVDSR